MSKSATMNKRIAFAENPKELLAIADVISKVLGKAEANKADASSAAKLVWKTLVAEKMASTPSRHFFEGSSDIVAARKKVKTVSQTGAFERRTYDLFMAALVITSTKNCGCDSPACDAAKARLREKLNSYGVLLEIYSLCMSKRTGGISRLTVGAADGLILSGQEPAGASGENNCDSELDMLKEMIRQLDDAVRGYEYYCGE